MSQRELSGRTALVTGVTRRAGIGAAIARELGRAGARLFVTFFRQYDRQQTWGVEPGEPESLLAELSGIADEVDGAELDLSLPASPAELFRQARQRFGCIDILVNNAAHWEEGGIGQVRADQLDRHYAVNVRAPVLLCAEFAKQRKRTAPGRIINITSGQSANPMPGQIAYVATKAALDALTLTLGAELARAGITVNAVDPGPTDTGWIPDELRSKLVREWPGGISSPEAIGRLVRRLAGDEATGITGQVIRAQAAATAGLFTKTQDLESGTVHELPADFREAIEASPAARRLWTEITPLARNEWICWVTSAKQHATRRRRIATGIDKMQGGMRRPCCWPGCPHR